MGPANLLFIVLAAAAQLLSEAQFAEYPTANLSTSWTNSKDSLPGQRVLQTLFSDASLIWSSGSSGRSVAGMVITKDSNLVLFDHSNGTVWQSFDHPSDVLLPRQSLVEGTRLVANTSATNWTENQLYMTVLPRGLYGYVESTPSQLYYATSVWVNESDTGNGPTKVTFLNSSLSLIVQSRQPSSPHMFKISLPAAKSTQYVRLESDGHLRLYERSQEETTCTLLSDVTKVGPGGLADDSTPLRMQRMETVVQSSPSSAASHPVANKRKVILGIALALVTATIFIAIVITVCLLRRRKYEDNDEDLQFDQLPGMPTRFPFDKLRECTEGFSKKLGEGGFGSVFAGKLGEERVAVKRLEGARQGKKEFLAEVETIGSIEHINLVRLIGFCTEKFQRLLVYEYMSGGSLDRWIYYRHDNAPLDWHTRCGIILDIAKGLCYLHEECRRKIAHLDIKPQNILLDENFNAKVADFGLSKLIDRDQSKVMTMMRGTPGYMAPEWLTSQITEKVDVYSFGVVVMELISGRKNIDNSLPEESSHLINLLRGKARDNQLSDLIDKHNEDMLSHQEQVIQMMELAMWCLLNDAGQRPSMSTVTKVLEGGMSIETAILPRFLNSNSILPLENNPTAYSVQPQASVLSGPR
ncbi:G-type lectin S-receptor-like serine/threonine-protein kinase SD2-5 [Triticum dicoccoides]|uniref:G-type lectin S-receptor-like serine/threonine-protein kinase SD2-5 n=1 Tax=Triticum dicoccoides TaxID=85692 RepID=UPI0018903260|nr:G-type lectin S-receptor-like serine/threonine-protein kinase SD2-5 [Triticum dicoccoides]